MANIGGHVDPGFEAVREAFAEQLESGEELGAGLTVNVDGRNVVDLWGGWADEAKTKPWKEDTLVVVWSSTKTVSALATLVNVDRGALDVDAPVAKYWPEFAQNGKDGVLVRHVLSHCSGVSGWDQPIDFDEVIDLERSVPRLAKQAPWFDTSHSGYHAVTYGHLLGELVRRASGKPMKQFVAEELAGPLGADFQIGALEKDRDRIAPVIPPPPMLAEMLTKMDPKSVAVKTFTGPAMDAKLSWTPEFRKTDMGGVNGHSTARGLAKVMSTVTLGGTVDGKKILSPATIETIFREQVDNTDLVVGIPLRFGIGFGLTGGGTTESIPWLPQGKVCFWGGWGGSMIVMDVGRRVTFSYVMNSMAGGLVGNPRGEAYFKATYKALGVEGY